MEKVKRLERPNTYAFVLFQGHSKVVKHYNL